jgi:hypothetical protein
MFAARRLFSFFGRSLGILGLLCPLLARASQGFDAAGPIYSAYPLTLVPGRGEDFLGPFYSGEIREDDREWGIHPLFSYVTNSAIDSMEWDFAYPVVTYDRYGSQSRWQFIQLFSLAGGKDQADLDAKRVTIFPIYFQQRAQDTNLNYTALVPFYGEIKKHLFSDDIQFTMFPLYARVQKKDVVTDNYLMPFFHLRHGDQLSGWQLWPVVGNETKGTTYRTNSFGTVESEGPHRKFFAAWPFYFDEKTGIGTTNWQSLRAVCPFYMAIRSAGHDTTVYAWPLYTAIDNRDLGYHEYGFAWPLYTWARGPGKTTTRIFPLYSDSHNDSMKSSFFLWPLYKYNRLKAEQLERERTRLLFYWWSDLVEKNLATGQAFRRKDLWPLFTWRHELDGRERLQVLSVIEPLVPYSKSIERNYSPVYALWRSESNPAAGKSSESLLWNLYRREKAAKVEKRSFLFGLFRYERGENGRRWRLFYIPFGKARPPAVGKAAGPAR